LLLAGDGCFEYCSLVNSLFFYLQTVGSRCFYQCTGATDINLSNCTQLGLTHGDDLVFYGITGNTIILTIPAALMTCNLGGPDGDIAYLQANNTVTIITV